MNHEKLPFEVIQEIAENVILDGDNICDETLKQICIALRDPQLKVRIQQAVVNIQRKKERNIDEMIRKEMEENCLLDHQSTKIDWDSNTVPSAMYWGKLGRKLE